MNVSNGSVGFSRENGGGWYNLAFLFGE